MAELDTFLARYPEGSLKRNVLFQKYLKDVKYAKQATSKSEVAKFQQVVKFLRKYAATYNLDYVLMARPGVPGVTAGPLQKEPRRSHRRYAGHASPRQGHEGWRHRTEENEYPRG